MTSPHAPREFISAAGLALGAAALGARSGYAQPSAAELGPGPVDPSGDERRTVHKRICAGSISEPHSLSEHSLRHRCRIRRNVQAD